MSLVSDSGHQRRVAGHFITREIDNGSLLTFRWEVVAAGDLGFSGDAAVQRVALLVEARARRSMDAAVHWEKNKRKHNADEGK